ncbi:MAG: sugar phosphate isomerase/epimerase family protein [Verrucomicrobiota bacterium]
MDCLDRLCVHTVTCQPWKLEEAVAHFAAAGVRGITTWREAVAGRDLAEARRLITDAGLTVVSHCRGGFFPAMEAAGRRKAIDENRTVIDEAAALGAPVVVLVCGATPGQPLETSRAQIAEGIAAVLPHAQAAGVRLAIEPLHPMYAGDRSAVNTLRQANEMCAQLDSPALGVALDVYHVWWEPGLEAEIRASGEAGTLLAFHVCDWLLPTEDLLLDRGLMGEGCIDIAQIRRWVEAAGFGGWIEVEIFSKRHWARDQAAFLAEIVRAYSDHV